MNWFDLVEEILVAGGRSSTASTRLSVVPSLQQSLYGGYCFYRMKFFTKFFCHFFQGYCAALEKLIYDSFEIINETIAYHMVLYLFLYYIFCLNFVVGVPTLCYLIFSKPLPLFGKTKKQKQKKKLELV